MSPDMRRDADDSAASGAATAGPMRPRFDVGGKALGDGAPCFLIAEAGSNHNGSLERALELIDVAADAGADAVKFQTFRAAKLYPRSAGTSDYLGDPTPIYDIIAAMEMPPEWLPTLAAHARARGLCFISSPFHEAAVELLDPYVDAFKIASYELTHAPLLRAVAARGKPVLLSTGASTLDEVAQAVVTLADAGCDRLALMQCTASYPTPPASVHVRAMVTLRERFGLPTGLSDHSRDPRIAPTVAAALGAALIEKHFTLSNELPGPDHRFAVEGPELAALCAAVRGAEAVLGSPARDPDAIESELRQFARRSVFALRPLAAGTVIQRDDVEVLRHGKNAGGLPPEALDRVVGGRALRALQADVALQPGDVAPPSQPPLQLRRATRLDAQLLLAWSNDPTARAASFGREPIAWSDHLRWLDAALADPQRRLYLASQRAVPVGTGRLDLHGDSAATISINLAPQARGLGLAKPLLAALEAEAARAGVATLVAWIAADNVASRRSFEGAGYRLVDGSAPVGRPGLRFERTIEPSPVAVEAAP